MRWRPLALFIGCVLLLSAGAAYSDPVEHTFSTTGSIFIDPLLTGLTSVSGSFIYENAAVAFDTNPATGELAYGALSVLSGTADGNSFDAPLGVVVVLNDGFQGSNDFFGMTMNEEEDLHGFTFAGMPLVEVLFFWIEGTGGIVDFLDDQSLASVLPPTVAGRLRLTFLDGVGVEHFAIFSVDVVPGLPVSTRKTNHEGELSIVELDLGGGIYSGVSVSSRFSFEMDRVTQNGFISDGTTATAFYNFGEDDVENNLVLDASTAALVNSLAGTSFVAGDSIDLIGAGSEGIEGKALTSGGGEIGVFSGIVLDSLAFDDEEEEGKYPPNPDDILVIFFEIEEEDVLGSEIYLAFGVIDGPACSAPDGVTDVLQDNMIVGASVSEVCDKITVGPNFAVMGPNGDLTLRAGRTVEILNGFSIGVGAKLTVVIDNATWNPFP